MRWSGPMVAWSGNRGRRWMNEGTLLMIRRLLPVSGSRLTMVWSMMRCLVRCHERCLPGWCVRCIRVGVNSTIASHARSSRCVRWIMMRGLVRYLRQRVQHVMRKILRHSLYRFLIHSAHCSWSSVVRRSRSHSTAWSARSRLPRHRISEMFLEPAKQIVHSAEHLPSESESLRRHCHVLVATPSARQVG